MKARLTGSIAAAALVGVGLACPGVALAAEPTWPAALDFSPQDIAASTDGVYAVGNNDDYSHGYVAEVGAGDPVDLGTDSSATDVAASGSQVYVLGSETVDDPDLGVTSFPTLWTFEDGGNGLGLSPADKTTFPADSFIEDGLGLDADGKPLVVGFDENDDSVVWFPADDVEVPLQHDHTSPSAVAAAGDAVYVVGSTYSDGDDFTRAAAWRLVKDGSDWNEEQLFLSPDLPAYSQSDDVVVDQATGVAYVAHQSSDPDTGEDTPGLAVIDGDVVTEIPLDSAAWSLALSPDGETLYGSTGGQIWSMATDRLTSYDEDNPAPVGSFPSDSYGSSLAVSADGDHLYAGDTELPQVLKFEAPSAPTGVTATAWSDGSAAVSWTAPVSAGGFESNPDYLSYRVTVQDNAGGVPVSKTAWGSTDASFRGLATGHTYTVSVVALTAFTGAAGTTQVTTPVPTTTPTTTPTTPTTTTTPTAPAVLAASTPSIGGKAKVGETLTAKPGNWTDGAKLTYQWKADGKPIKHATGRKLKLTKTLKGERISVTVTGSLAGYQTASRASKQTGRVAGAQQAGSKPGKGHKGHHGHKSHKPGKGHHGHKPGKPGKGHR